MINEFIKNKYKSVKIFRIILLAIAVLSIVSSFICPYVEFSISYMLIMLSATSTLICSVIYLVSFHPFTSCIKWLKEKGLEDIASDIVLESPTLARSKIYCGKDAFFCKKPCVIIPYSEVAWVYLYERQAYGLTVEKAIVVYTTDGKKFSLKATAEEFQWLLENYVAPCSPNLVVGFGYKQKAQYRQLNPHHSKTGKKLKRLWGFVLMGIASVLLILMLINIKTAEIMPLAVTISGSFLSGLVLYILGNKK